MDAVTNHQSGSTRISPLVVAVAASVTIACLVGVSAYTGMLPGKRVPTTRDEVPLPRSESKPSQAAACALCGTIESIRSVDVPDDAGGTSGTTAPRKAFRVTLRMDDGSFRTISLSSPPAFAVGDKVRVVEGRLVKA